MRISWSQLQCYLACPLQYQLRYVDRLRRPRDRRPFVVGSTVHTLVQAWASAGYPAEFFASAARPALEAQCAGLSLSNASRLALLRQALEAAMVAARLYREQQFAGHGARIEQRFNVALEGLDGHRIGGAVDVYDPVTRTIWDLKCSVGTASADVRQLWTYTLALRQLGQIVERVGFLYPLRASLVEVFAVDEAAVEEQRTRLGDLARTAIAAPEAVALPGPACYWCEFHRQSECPATAARVPPGGGPGILEWVEDGIGSRDGG